MPRVSTQKFFREQSTFSRVKAEIVAKYVNAWAQALLSFQKRKGLQLEVAYVDLFSGPGTYDDGSKSTPLLVVESAMNQTHQRSGLRTFFNDKNLALMQSLKQEITALSNIANLVHPPQFSNQPASIRLIDNLQLAKSVPQFYFLDQFGYADVTPATIRRIFFAQRCDCTFFFKTSRVIAAISNPKVRAVIDSLFDPTRMGTLRDAIKNKSAVEKEQLVLNALQEEMAAAGAPFFQAFPFRTHEENSAKHHLIYVGKNELGLKLMKDIMAKASSRHEDGIATMEYAETDAHPSLFAISPMDELQQDLLKTFAGRTLTVDEIFSNHHIGWPRCTRPNYQEALRRLEENSLIIADPPREARPKRHSKVTMAGETLITFNSLLGGAA